MRLLNELLIWISEEQKNIPIEDRTETQDTIYSTLQLVKRKVEYMKIREKENCKQNKTSPGDYGC